MTNQIRRKVKDLFDIYLEAIEKNQPALLSNILSEDVISDFSTSGIHQGIEDVKNTLSWKGKEYDDHRIKVTNFTVHCNDELIYQTAYIQAMVSYERDGFLHWFLYGGHFLNTLKNTEELRFSSLRFDLDYVDGNTSFVEGWWKLIDYSFFMGQKLRSCIIGELESPWRLTDDIHDLSDEEEIKDLQYRYSFAMDTADFEDLSHTYSDNICAVMPQGNFCGKHDFTAYFKYVRLKEPTFCHAVVFKELHIENNHASAVLLRTEPNRRGTRFLHKDNKNAVFFSGEYLNEYEKIDGKWQITKIDYHSKQITIPLGKEIRFLEDMSFAL